MLFLVMDVDGTILNSEHLYFKYMADAVEEVLGKDVAGKVRAFMASDAFTSFYGMGDREILDKLLEGRGRVELVYETYLSKVNANVSKIISKENFIPGFEDFLSKTSYPFCLVSSSHRRALRRLLELLPRQPDFIITGDDVNNHKPHPEPYLKAKEKIPSNFRGVVFEDALAGKQSAEAAGFSEIVCMRTCYWEPCFKDWHELLASGFLSSLS